MDEPKMKDIELTKNENRRKIIKDPKLNKKLKYTKEVNSQVKGDLQDDMNLPQENNKIFEVKVISKRNLLEENQKKINE